MAEQFRQHTEIGSNPGAPGSSTYTTGDAGSKGRDTIEEAKQAGAEVVDHARQVGADVVGRAKDESRSMLSRQKEAAAGQADSLAHAFRDTAHSLAREHHEQTGHYIGYAADQLESLGRRLRERDVDALIGDAQDYARRSPGVFFGGAVLAGFLLARFLKSSAERHHEAGERADYAPESRAASGSYASSYRPSEQSVREGAGELSAGETAPATPTPVTPVGTTLTGANLPGGSA